MTRLFIAINLPQEVPNKLQTKIKQIESRYQEMKIRFTLPEQWHFTLIFLGYQEEKIIENIKEAMMRAVSRFPKPFKIYLEKITYGPPGPKARMIWVTTTKETSLALGELKKILEDELAKTTLKWRREDRPFRGHITLSRFLMKSLKNLPPLNEPLDFDFEIKEIDLMKSTLKREGSLYEKLFTVAF